MKEIRINNFKEKLFYEKLSNGLEVFLVPIKSKKDYTVIFATKYGGRDIKFKMDDKLIENPTGIAHFLEHKMFEKDEDPFKFYEKYGIEVNASTSHDFTGYYIQGNKSYKKSLVYLLNWLQSLDITFDLVEKEKGIILEEASMYKDSPDRVISEKIRHNIFAHDPYRYKVIGSDSDIKKITKEQLQLCYEAFYRPDNMVIISVGNFNCSEAMEVIKENTKEFKNPDYKIVKYYDNEDDSVFKRYEKVFLNVDVPRVSLAYKVNKSWFKKFNISNFELDMYLNILIQIGLGLSSSIREEWLNEKLFVNAFYRIDENENYYIIEFNATSKKPDILIKQAHDYLQDINISKESFERQKKLWIAREVNSVGNINAIKYNILDDVLDYGYFIPNKIDYIRNLNYETLENIKYELKFNNKVEVKVLPKIEKNVVNDMKI